LEGVKEKGRLFLMPSDETKWGHNNKHMPGPKPRKTSEEENV